MAHEAYAARVFVVLIVIEALAGRLRLGPRVGVALDSIVAIDTMLVELVVDEGELCGVEHRRHGG